MADKKETNMTDKPKPKTERGTVSFDITDPKIKNAFDSIREECSRLTPWSTVTNADVIRYALMVAADTLDTK